MVSSENIKKALEILQAFNEGKTIEQFVHDGTIAWEKVPDGKTLLNVLYDANIPNLRIKKEPSYRPYKNVNEFLNDQKEHGPYLKVINKPLHNSYDTYLMPIAIRGHWLDFNGAVSNDGNIHKEVTITHLMGNYTWQDGKTCGVEIIDTNN